jgi:DNA-binding MarR family transcriptional regulator
MIQDTTLEAYKIIEPELGNLQHEIYNVIISNPGMSNHDLARFLHWEINRVTPRVKELRDKGLVICGGTKTDRITHKEVMTWTTP